VGTEVMRLDDLNALDEESAARALARCCGSSRWVQAMVRARPFETASVMTDTADAIWRSLEAHDWQMAFAAHPRIGAPASGWAHQEQSGARSASEDTRDRLAAANRQYEARFGYIFIVCATGKTAEDMLELLEKRLHNGPADELAIAAEEQRKITRVRLARLVEPVGATRRSPP
jgi:2-oxo-4-hydroxy-4-carboxy-5-ureidoimidazoline decarboxylase